MKSQFLHEHHNRQDKVTKAGYHEELRHPLPREMGDRKERPSPRARRTPPPSFTYTWVMTCQRDFTFFEPVVAAVLLSFAPTLNLARLKDCIRSFLCDNSSFRVETKGTGDKTAVYAALRSAVDSLIARKDKSPPSKLLQWHDKVVRQSCRDPSAHFEVPQELQDWLRKASFQTKPPTTT